MIIFIPNLIDNDIAKIYFFIENINYITINCTLVKSF